VLQDVLQDALEETGVIRRDAVEPLTALPPAAPMPQATPLAALGPRVAAMPPVSVRDAGGGRVQIEARDASVAQVLAALQASGLIRLSGSDQLSRTVSGTYTGTLPQVLSRILDGQSYFLRVTASGTELHAVDASRDTNAASRSASGDADAALRSGVAGNVEAAPAPAPAAAFALSTANPVSKARARERALRSAKTR
jgi:hypothetical protein